MNTSFFFRELEKKLPSFGRSCEASAFSTKVTYCSWRYSSKTDRSLSAGAHSEENERDKVPRRRERVAATQIKREEFIMVVVFVSFLDKTCVLAFVSSSVP
jgi:hypothetical protein